MPTTDPRVDAYIAKAAPFARPILDRLRATLHAANPAIVEDIKWGVPQYAYKGLFAATPAFKQHVRLVLWKRSALAKAGLPEADTRALKQLDRLMSLADVPSNAVLTRLIQAAARLTDENAKPAPSLTKKPALRTPPHLSAALKKNKTAHAAFAKMSAGHKREYIKWIGEAKTDATRDRRVAQAVVRMTRGS